MDGQGFNWSHSQVSEAVMDNVYLVRKMNTGMKVVLGIPPQTIAVRAPAARALATAEGKETQPC